MPIYGDNRNILIALQVWCYRCGGKFTFPLCNVSIDCASPDAIANIQQAVKINAEQALAEIRMQHVKNAPKCVPRFVTLLDY